MKGQVSDNWSKSVTKPYNDCFTVNSSSNSITVSPHSGGRIISFKNNGFEFLTDKLVHPENYGSTFWSSPQSCWNWPPPSVLDSNPYFTEKDGNSILLKSEIDPVTGFQFTKDFSAGENGYLNIGYGIINRTDKVINAACWEITRVKKGGLLFFPIGEKRMRGKQFETAECITIDEVLWYRDKLKKPETHKLNIADGLEGWIAYSVERKLLIKRFTDVKPEMQAPGEAEILFYISPEADYIEVEVQGKYEPILPSSKLLWSIAWTAVDIPEHIENNSPNKELVEFTRRIVLSQ